MKPVSLLVLLVLPLHALPQHAQSAGGSNPTSSGAGLTPGTRPGMELPKPGGGSFFLDGHQNGQARAFLLEEIRVGRLVEVHGLLPSGALDPAPAFRDFLVGETVQGDGSNYRFYRSPSTQVEHMIVLREPGAPEPSPGAGTFAELVRAAERAAAILPPRAPLAAVVASVPRNAALSLRFGDLLDDGAPATAALVENVRVALGTAAASPPFQARVVFDPNHGGLRQGSFHATRVLVDTSVSVFESDELAVPLPIQPLGLPPGSGGTGASFHLRLPTRLDPGAGQFTRLTNLAGRGLASTDNGPVDAGSASLDLVRAARAGSPEDPSAGFLLDLGAPEVVGEVPVSVTQVQPDPAGTSGFAFLVDWVFQSPCAAPSRLGDALEIAGRTLEVVAPGPVPDGSGAVHGVRVRLAQRALAQPADLLGSGRLAVRLRANLAETPCWFGFTPAPSLPPGNGLAPVTSFALRFSEPMDLASFDPYDNFRIVQGTGTTPADAQNSVVVTLHASSDRARIALEPVLPLAHVMGEATPYHIELRGLPEGTAGPKDLAGSAVAAAPSAVVRVERSAASETSGGIVLRFDSADEVPGPGFDLRGNHFYDLAAGTIRPRPTTFFSATIERQNPVPALMIPFPPGVQTPLSPLGSKLHSVWRHCDLGWNVRDETKYDVDVVGLNWSPANGSVVNDFFPGFEIRLAHARRLPDEALDQNLLPRYPASGLVGRNQPYENNVLQDPLSPQTVVHPRELGYQISAANLFQSDGGTPLLPYPLNQDGGALESYTWRDTSVLSKAGPNGAGLPLRIEVVAGVEAQFGTLAPADSVPSIGLPLLVEYRCYPTDLGIGLNALDISLAINSSALPAFRSYSTGGVNSAGQVVTRDPDLQEFPSGGFNPYSTPPGLPTTYAAENASYIGQIDLVTRISRVHTVWIDSGAVGPDYAGLALGVMASGSAHVTAELRGATGFLGTAGAELDALQLDAYGDVEQGSVAFLGGAGDWKASPDEIDGARYVQLRLTLANDIEAGTSPELDFLALAFH